MQIILASIAFVIIINLLCNRYKKPRPAKSFEIPKADPESNYNKDYCNLLNAITHAKNNRELRMARREVTRFRKRYKDRSSYLVKDSVELISHIDQRGVALEYRMQDTN